jgi:mannitol/fructose-specific phosphotransferase system IIA component
MVEELINSNIELIHRLKEKETNPEAIKTMTDTIIKLQHVNEVFIDKWLDR